MDKIEKQNFDVVVYGTCIGIMFTGLLTLGLMRVGKTSKSSKEPVVQTVDKVTDDQLLEISKKLDLILEKLDRRILR